MGVFWNSPSITVNSNFTFILLPPDRVRQIFNVISYSQSHLVCHKSFLYQIQRQQICHLMNYKSGLFTGVGALQHLAGAHAVIFRAICLDIRNRTGFPTPGMVDQKLRVHPEKLIQKLLIIIFSRFSQRTGGNISHGENPMGLQLLLISFSHAPEIRQRLMGPENLPVRHFIQRPDPHSVFIRRNMLRHNVHGDFAEIEIRADSRSGGDSRILKYIQDHFPRQLFRCHLICFQIMSGVDKHLINRIHMDILRRNIFQINFVDSGAVFHIKGHPGRSRNISQLQLRILFQLLIQI